jgi:hypothetical protein
LKPLRLGAGLALGAVLACATACTRTPAAGPPSSFAASGPQVGQRLPEFRLPDTSGRPRTFADLTGPQGLVLVFNQSADW